MNSYKYSKTKRAAREALLISQKGRCYYCNSSVNLPTRGKARQLPRTATLDHIIPQSQGGELDPSVNCVVACLSCNSDRGDRDARLFMLEKMGLV